MLDSESAPSLNPMTMWDAVCFFPSHTVCLSVPLQLNSYFRDADIGGEGVVFTTLSSKLCTVFLSHCQFWMFLQLAVSPYN